MTPLFWGGRSRPFQFPASEASLADSTGKPQLNEADRGKRLRRIARFSHAVPPPLSVRQTLSTTAALKTAGFPSLSAALISICKAHGPPCRIVVNRDSFRELRFGAVWFCGKVKPCSVNAASWFRLLKFSPTWAGPVQAIREASPQAHYHFTQADQVNQLVSASEADPDLGFMGRTMALCSLPRTNPGNQLRYVRCNGPYTLVMNAGGLHKLPFGNLPRC